MKLKPRLMAVILAITTMAAMTGCGSSSVTPDGSAAGSDPVTDKTETEVDENTAEYLKLPEAEGLEFEENGDGTCTVSGPGAFDDTVLVLPSHSDYGSTVTGIDEYAFYENEFTAVVFNGADLDLSDYAFSDSDITELIIKDSNLRVGDDAFAYCDDLQDISIYSSTIETDEYSFYESGDDAVINASDSTLSLGQNAFSGSGIISINISGCETELEKSAFAYCDDIETVNVTGGSFTVDSYGFYDSGSSMNVGFEDCDVEIKDDGMSSSGTAGIHTSGGSIEIGKSGLAYCDDLEKAAFETSTVSIGEYAFYDCSELTELTIGTDPGDGNTIDIDDNGFSSSGLTTVDIKGGTVNIGNSGFAYCEDLSQVTIGEGELKVKDYAFYGCADGLKITYAGNVYSADKLPG